MSKRVIFATIALHNMAGGLERNIVRIANYLSTRGYDVSLLSFDLPDAQAFYAIEPGVKWFRLGRTRPHQKISFGERLALLGRIREALRGEKATLIVFHHGILLRLLLASLFLNIRTFCSERSALSLYKHVQLSKWNLNFFLLFLVSKVIVQFESYRKDYPAPLRSRIVTIPNVVEKAGHLADVVAPSANGRFSILALGRFCDQKNFTALVVAFASLARDFPQWDLYLIGEGAFREILEKQILHAGLRERVFLPGSTTDTQSRFLQSHIYAMPSKWEGFPNALAEAMAHGLPAVGYAGCQGVSDLIEDGRSGLLAAGNGDVMTLAGALERLMADPALRAKMGQAAASSMQQYLPERIYPEWEKLLKDL